MPGSLTKLEAPFAPVTTHLGALPSFRAPVYFFQEPKGIPGMASEAPKELQSTFPGTHGSQPSATPSKCLTQVRHFRGPALLESSAATPRRILHCAACARSPSKPRETP